MNLILRFWQQLLRFTRQYSEKDAEAYRISQYYSYLLHTFIVILFCVDYLLWRYSTARELNFKSWGLEDNTVVRRELRFLFFYSWYWTLLCTLSMYIPLLFYSILCVYCGNMSWFYEFRSSYLKDISEKGAGFLISTWQCSSLYLH